MHRPARLILFFCAVTAAAQESPKYTARELFYSAASDSAPAPKAAPKPAPPAPKKAVSPGKPSVPPATPSAPAAAVDPPRPPASQPTQPVALPGGGAIVKASLETAPAPATGTPLGLKYPILRKSGDDMLEVPRETIFHSGDRIQVSVQTNGPGYLYIVTQGSSGEWQPLFPTADVADGDNHVDG